MGFKIIEPSIPTPQGLTLSNLFCTIHAKFSIDRNGNPSVVLPDPTKAYVLRATLHYYVDLTKPPLFTAPFTAFLTSDDLSLASGNFCESIYYLIQNDLKYTKTEKY